MSTPLYVVGPLLPPNYGSGATPRIDDGDAEFNIFLDTMLSQHGLNSVLYVRFLFPSSVSQ